MLRTYNGLRLGSSRQLRHRRELPDRELRLTTAFVDSRKAPFLSNNRIWIGGYFLYQTDVSDYGAILNFEGTARSTETPQYMTHRWDSGWMPIAMAALYQDSINLH